MNLVGVYGASGCGRGIMPLIREQHPHAELVFIDDALSPGFINGHKIVDWVNFLDRAGNSKAVCIAIAASETRKKLYDRCAQARIPLVSARATTVIQMDDVVIGSGACLSPFVTLTSNIRIGHCFHANINSYVEHDCVIGDFVTLAPGAKVNGNVKIGDHAYVGAGAVIRQGVEIGAGAVIGMGAIVTRDVPPGLTVVGNPARPLIKG